MEAKKEESYHAAREYLGYTAVGYSALFRCVVFGVGDVDAALNLAIEDPEACVGEICDYIEVLKTACIELRTIEASSNFMQAREFLRQHVASQLLALLNKKGASLPVGFDSDRLARTVAKVWLFDDEDNMDILRELNIGYYLLTNSGGQGAIHKLGKEPSWNTAADIARSLSLSKQRTESLRLRLKRLRDKELLSKDVYAESEAGILYNTMHVQVRVILDEFIPQKRHVRKRT